MLNALTEISRLLLVLGFQGVARFSKAVLLGGLLGYRMMLSPVLGPACRFYPSCSQYALDAVGKHGVLRGIELSIRRLAKCQPWHPGGIDFVP